MASGYARSTGKVGVAFVTSGPGATNTVTPVRDAAADSIPMVVLTGQVPRPGHRERRVSRSAGVQYHDVLRQACVLGGKTRRTGGHASHGVLDRPHRPAGARGGGYSERRAVVARAPIAERACCRSGDTVDGWTCWPNRACRKNPRGSSLNISPWRNGRFSMWAAASSTAARRRN
jgi:hypothetical protein